MKTIEVKATSVDAAIEDAIAQLGITREQADIEIISEGGLFSKAEVRVSEKVGVLDRVQSFLVGLFENMRLKCNPSCTETDGIINISISGPDSGLAIGYRGEVLDAIQYLALLVANQQDGNFQRVVINAENYREKRERILQGLAEKLAIKANRTARPVELEPMNPFERRIIHAALSNSKLATTESRGEEPNRYVVIIPKERDNSLPIKDFSVKKNGPPKVKSYGYNKKRF
jgi:spoIIIJ-associated protein